MREGARIPKYQTSGSAGCDLVACLDESVVLEPGERALIPTGIGIALPIGYEAQVRSRSGFSMKNGVSLINGVGTIDSDYRGEIGVGLINLSEDAVEINNGMRVAQLVVAPCCRVDWQEVDALEITDRNTDGWGSTGVIS